MSVPYLAIHVQVVLAAEQTHDVQSEKGNEHSKTSSRPEVSKYHSRYEKGHSALEISNVPFLLAPDVSVCIYCLRLILLGLLGVVSCQGCQGVRGGTLVVACEDVKS